MALRSDGTVHSWGNNEFQQLGHSGASEPRQVAIEDVIAVSTGRETSLALKDDGSLWAWGGKAGAIPQRIEGVSCRTLLAGAVCMEGTGATREVDPGNTLPQHQGPGILATERSGLGALWLKGDGDRKGMVVTLNGDDATPWSLTLGQVARRLGGSSAVLAPRGVAWLYRQGGLVPAAELPPVVDIYAHTVVTATGAVWEYPESFIGPTQRTGISLFEDTWLLDDPDDDGLSNLEELDLGTDPYDRDTNRDGINDGVSVSILRDPISLDLDGDGLSNADEIVLGTNPNQADSDGDGVADGLDAYPLDPTRWEPEDPDPGDTSPPGITLMTPANVELVSSLP